MIGYKLNFFLDYALVIARNRKHEYVSIAHTTFCIFHDPLTLQVFRSLVPDFDAKILRDNLKNLLKFMPKKLDSDPIETYELYRVINELSNAKTEKNVLDFLVLISEDETSDVSKILAHYGVDKSVINRAFNENYKIFADNELAFEFYSKRRYGTTDDGEALSIDEMLEARNLKDEERAINNAFSDLNDINDTSENSPFAEYVKQEKLKLTQEFRVFDEMEPKFEDTQMQKEIPSQLYTTNLVEAAKNGKIDPIVGREKEIEKTLQTLCRRKKNNPVLVGEAGVGKTAIVEGIALKIANGDVPEKLKDKVIYSLDVGAIVAGTTLRGEFEQRLKDLIDEFSDDENAILFIDEIHSIIGTGANKGELDMSNILKPALANGAISCIGATTYSEFRSFSSDKALERRFCKVDIGEPSIEDSVEILKGIAKKYEDFHAVKFSDEILHEAVILAKRYISDKFLPDSAIDLIDETGASFWIKNEKRVEVSKDDLLNTLGEIANISNLAQNEDNETTLLNLEANIKKEIFGQDEAVKSLCKALFRSYAGLKNDTSPIGVFLFTGSSGVGKTELAKVLAKNLGVYFDRYDMSEYMEEYSVSKLIGSAPGYVGFENGGILTNSVRKHPYSVILFDEIEKANKNLMNIFLGIFDNATLSDNTGQSADFKNTIIIMTSNLGTKEAPQIGFQKDESYKIDNAVKSFFAPEFRNRLDKIINFNPLNNEILEKIVDKSVSELQNKLENITINLSKNAKEFLIKKGYSAEFGARNLKRVINSEISDNLSSEILFGKLKNGGVVNIDVVNENLNFDFQSSILQNQNLKNLESENLDAKFENCKMKK